MNVPADALVKANKPRRSGDTASKYLLDTNILIYFLKNRPPIVADRINGLPANVEIGMSFITYAELLKGVARSSRAQESEQNLIRLTRQIPVWYQTNQELCRHYALQFTRLKMAGTPVGANDLWIACHALAESATLVTNNTREFARVSGLRLENWAE